MSTENQHKGKENSNIDESSIGIVINRIILIQTVIISKNLQHRSRYVIIIVCIRIIRFITISSFIIYKTVTKKKTIKNSRNKNISCDRFFFGNTQEKNYPKRMDIE